MGWILALLAAGAGFLVYETSASGKPASPSSGPPLAHSAYTELALRAANAILVEAGAKGCASPATIAAYQVAINNAVRSAPGFDDPEAQRDLTNVGFPLRIDGVLDTPTLLSFQDITGATFLSCADLPDVAQASTVTQTSVTLDQAQAAAMAVVNDMLATMGSGAACVTPDQIAAFQKAANLMIQLDPLQAGTDPLRTDGVLDGATQTAFTTATGGTLKLC